MTELTEQNEHYGKFRAWDKKNLKWVYYTTEAAFHGRVFNQDKSQNWLASSIGFENIVDECQFTGFKAMYGETEDVYSGDILQFDFEDEDMYTISERVEVTWCAHHGQWEMEGHRIEHHPLSSYADDGIELYGIIVGDIHNDLRGVKAL